MAVREQSRSPVYPPLDARLAAGAAPSHVRGHSTSEERETLHRSHGAGDATSALDELAAPRPHAAAPPASSRLPAVGDVIAGRYRIEEILGVGGMGAVFRATHLVSERSVAIKWMLRPSSDAQARRRFVREARAAARIEHPNVVEVYDAGQHGDDVGLYLVMPLLRGESLRARLARGPFDVAALIDLLLPAMRGVSAVHAAGIVHRDLKPENIFLGTTRGEAGVLAKVLDFGISATGNDDPNETITSDGALLGTPAYMSPEQLRGPRSVDVRTDVYAFGVILYEALCGVRPFVAQSHHGLALAIVHDPARSLRVHRPDLPAALDEVILRALEKDPDARQPSVAALIDALAPFGTGPALAAQARPVRRNVRAIAYAVCAALSLGALVTGLARSRRDGAGPRTPTHVSAAPQRAVALPPADAAPPPVLRARLPATLPPEPLRSVEPRDAAVDAGAPRKRTRKSTHGPVAPRPALQPIPPAQAAPAPAARSGRITADDL